MYADFRKLNAGTLASAYSMALQQELIMSTGRMKHIPLFDLRRGYWPVPLAQSAWLLTAFVYRWGQFAWSDDVSFEKCSPDIQPSYERALTQALPTCASTISRCSAKNLLRTTLARRLHGIAKGELRS